MILYCQAIKTRSRGLYGLVRCAAIAWTRENGIKKDRRLFASGHACYPSSFINSSSTIIGSMTIAINIIMASHPAVFSDKFYRRSSDNKYTACNDQRRSLFASLR